MCPNPLKPIKDSYSSVLKGITSRNMSLEDKFDVIEKALKSGGITSMQAVDLMEVALESLKNGVRRYPNILKLLKALLRYVGTKIPVKKKINGHEYVEMGDGLKWATCNVGASKPEEKGDYFPWGDAKPNDSSDPGNYKWGSPNDMTKYVTDCYTGRVIDNKTVLEPADDAASVNMGGTWRMPTIEEWKILLDTKKFNWAWDSTSEGYWVISKVEGYEGNKIFFPCPFGCRESDDSDVFVSGVSLWSSSLNVEGSHQAHYVSLMETKRLGRIGPRSNAFPVRGVSY